MKKIQLLLVMMLLPMVASADAVEIDGIYYSLVSKVKQAEVISNPNKYSGEVVIPEEVIYKDVEYNVTSIDDKAFAGCSGLTSVTIGNSVTSIGEYAFSDCEGLKTVTIGNSVTTIGIWAFSGCGLTSITIPNSVTSIGACVFKNCSGLISVTIGNGVTSISDSAFYECSSLNSVTIGNNVTSIGDWAFCKCNGLTSITIPNSVTSIGEYAFWNSNGLNSITISNNVTSIGKEAFAYCYGLTSVTIGNSVTSIGKEAFSDCRSLTSVHISDLAAWCKISFESGYANPLYFAKHLYLNGEEVKDLVIPNSVTYIGKDAFSGCALTSITIPNSVTSIGDWAFSYCSGLISITIPNSVTSIGKSAFRGCTDLTSITIGSGVARIGSIAFAKCSELTDVYCFAEKVPDTKSDAFQDSYIEYARLHVPAVSINLYQATEPWSGFKSIVGLNGEEPVVPETKQCSIPTISYNNGEIVFGCETEGVNYNYNITDSDIKSGSGAKVTLTATYTISVYTTKDGYNNSETATATLCWIDVEPKKEGITDGIANVPARAVMIQNNGSMLAIEGADDGTPVSVFDISGVLEGTATICNGAATINTNLQSGSIAIVKIGQKSVKVVIN